MNVAREPRTGPDDGVRDDPVIFGRVLNSTDAAHPMRWAEVQAWQPAEPGEVLWVHLDRTVVGVSAWLAALGISEATVELLTSNETRPRAFREGDTIVAVLRGVNFNPGAEPDDMVSLQIWADTTRVITLRRRRLQTPFDVLARVDAGGGDAPRSAGDLVTALVEQMIMNMNSVIIDMNERIDTLEAADQSESVTPILAAIADIRRTCLALKRYMSPQYDALIQIGRSAPAWLDEVNRRDIRETVDRLHRYIEDLDVSKESVLVLQDDVNNRAAARSNKTMYMLSIVAAIFLPLSFVTGLLGINVGGLPGTKWDDAFWVTVVLLFVILGVQLAIFRKLKWL